MDKNTNHLIRNILLFMRQDSIEDPSVRDSLEVARECLESVFQIYPDYKTSIGGQNALSLALNVNAEFSSRPKSPPPSCSSWEMPHTIYPDYRRSVGGQNAISLTPNVNAEAEFPRRPKSPLPSCSRWVMPQTQSSIECCSNWQPLQISAPPPSRAPSATSFEDSGDSEGYNIMGDELCAAQLFDEAIEQYSRAIKLSPSNAQYFLNRAVAYCFLESYKMCVDDCRQAIKLDSNFGTAYGRLGTAYRHMNDFESAYEAFIQASELEPHNEEYKWHLNIIIDKLNEPGTSRPSPQQNIKFNAAYEALDRESNPGFEMQNPNNATGDDANWSFSDSD